MFNKNEIQDIYNLTPMQAGILFHYMMDNRSFAYFQQLVFPAQGIIDKELFEKAFNKVVEKYDVLRTVFLYKNVNKPVQVVLKQRKASLEFREISHLSEEEKKNHVNQSIRQDKEKGFDLEKDIPMRVTIIKTAEREFTLIWSHHHIIMDGWCIGLVIGDFFRYYYAYKEGRAIPAETAPPYSRYLRWLDRQDKEKGIRFWQAYLDNYERKTSVPLKRFIRSGQSEYRLEEYHQLLDQTTTSVLNRIARENEVTLNIIFQVIWALNLQRYTDTSDVVFGAVVSGRPPEIDDIDQIVGLFINTIPVRFNLDIRQPFTLLIKAFQEKEVPTKSHEYLTLADIQAHTPLNRDLLDHILVFENYPIQANVNTSGNPQGNADFNILGNLQYHEQSNYDFNIVISPGEEIDLRYSFNSLAYNREDIIRMSTHVQHIIDSIIGNPNLLGSDLEIIPPTEKQRLLYEFNGQEMEFPHGQTVYDLFHHQALKTPEQTAVSSPIDIIEIYNRLEAENPPPEAIDMLSSCCFRENPYIHRASLNLPGQPEHFILLKSHRHNSVIINRNLQTLLGLFSGQVNLEMLYSYLKNLAKSEGIQPEYVFYPMDRIDLLEISVQFNQAPRTYSIGSYADFVQLVQLLHKAFILELAGITSGKPGMNTSHHRGKGEVKPPPQKISFPPPTNPFHDPGRATGESEGTPTISFEDIVRIEPSKNSTQILLLGDTPGMPSTGLLYLASYLVRKGIKAGCQFYDPSRDYHSMKANIENLLHTLQPRVVAVSMKWFPYIARVLDICTLIKDYAGKHSPDITVVVGGNTASYYWKEIITNDSIDILVRGDGEEPLLRICRGEETAEIPNCVYKKNGQIIENPLSYIQDETDSREIYLSHLGEILLSTRAPRFGTFFIYTHKGCAMNCLYCGGCNQAQQKTFNRKKVLRRGVEEVRKDIAAVTPYTSTLHFEFDIVDTKENLLDYCGKIWEGIDLSGHFCVFSSLVTPSAELIRLLSRTFKYVYWDYDICTYSERHRRQLHSLGLVKPQPSDAEILEFMEQCSRYDNIEVRVNLITGLPYFTLEDIESGEALLSRIVAYPSFGELHWARLHAQPGAPIVENPGQHRMHSYAAHYTDFLKFSRENFKPSTPYAFVDDLAYPYIYFEDDRLNSKITNFYLETNRKVGQIISDRRKSLSISNTLTYRELDKAAGQLCNVLRANGIAPGRIVGLMLERSLDIPVGILGIMKAGCAYMPIDPEFPRGRVEFMLKDSHAAALITTPTLTETHLPYFSNTSNTSPIIDITDIEHKEKLPNLPTPAISYKANSTTNPAYTIYTSGTTGKPKGVLLTHKNLVNYVHWFGTSVNLTSEDKTVLTSSFAFDLGYTSLYTSILNGGQLHILPREMYLLSDRLLDYIKQQEITYLKVTPSLFSNLVNSPSFSAVTCKNLRLTAIGGEAIKVVDIEKAHTLCPHLRIMNHYGPTEATIGSVATLVDFDRFEDYKAQPVIGKPIFNASVYILGKNMNLLPIGVTGELCIAGTCLGKGYLNRPELTAEKFVSKLNSSYMPHLSNITYLTRSSNKLYKTGDLARWLPNGTIEFLGRVDNQVKVRGYRVELGEIETRLLKHDKIENALVQVKESLNSKTGEKYLCAYIVPKGGMSRTLETPKAHPQDFKTITGGDILAVTGQIEQREKTGGKEITVNSKDRSITFDTLQERAGKIAAKITAEYDDTYRLSKSERIRYKRQLLLHGWGTASQEKLKSTTVFVAGAGGGASPTIMQLALAGIGTIITCDFDTVELSNLNRQFLHDETRLDMNKALSAKMTIERINPHVKVIPYTQKLTRENVSEIVGESAIIFDMFDGPADKFVLSEYATSRGIPHLILAMTDINAYAAVLHSPQTPCYYCLFDKKKLDSIVSGMQHYVDKYSKNPLPVVSTSLFISSGILVNEALKILLGFEEPAYNKFLYFNQRGATQDLVYTPGYKAMTHLFSDFFLETCRKQGFDWDIGWRGNFLEELTLEHNPACPMCGNGTDLEEKKSPPPMMNRPKAENPIERNEKHSINEKSRVQTVAILLNHGIDMAVGIMATLESGKTCVPLDPGTPQDSLEYIVEESGARIILTTEEHTPLAEKIRKRVNENIKIMNLESKEEVNTPSAPLTHGKRFDKIEPGTPTYILYAPTAQGGTALVETPFNTAVKELYRALSAGGNIHLPEVPEPGRGSQSPETTPLSADLRDFLLKELPDYMVPSHFILLDKIPLTPNGKVDGKALPEPGSEQESREKHIPPANDVEKKLAQIWSEVLGIEIDTIGRQTNFFEIGGHSLNAAIMVARVHKELDIRLSLAEVFGVPTLKELADLVSVFQWSADKEQEATSDLEEEEVIL